MIKKVLCLGILTLFLAPLQTLAANNSNIYAPPCKQGDLLRNDKCYQRLYYSKVLQSLVNVRRRQVVNPDFSRMIRAETSRTRQVQTQRNNARQTIARSQRLHLVKQRNVTRRRLGIRTRVINREIATTDRETGWQDRIGASQSARDRQTELKRIYGSRSLRGRRNY